MKTRFRLYRRHRGGRYYIHDETTGKQESLHTSDRPAALRLLHAKNEAVIQPAMNLQIAQVYLQHGDPALSSRTWQHVMEQIISTKTGNTRERWEYAIKDKALDLIRDPKLIQTLSSEHFLDDSETKVLFPGKRLFAAHAQLCHRDALATVAGAAKTSLASRAIQRETGNHR